MHPSFISTLISPHHGGALTLDVHQMDGENVLTGVLTDSAGVRYPIRDGIPCLLPSNLLDEQRSEMVARDAQVKDYDRMAILHLFGKVEIPLTLRALKADKADCLLEAGCGTGRMTRHMSRVCKTLVSIDFSFESLRVNRHKAARMGLKNVHFVQADLCNLPFPDDAFSSVVSCQVLEHVPNHHSRKAAVRELARVSKTGSRLVLSAYQHSIFTKTFGQKQGAHEGGIPYFRFSKSELRDLLSAGFAVDRISGKLVYLHLATCRNVVSGRATAPSGS